MNHNVDIWDRQTQDKWIGGIRVCKEEITIVSGDSRAAVLSELEAVLRVAANDAGNALHWVWRTQPDFVVIGS